MNKEWKNLLKLMVTSMVLLLLLPGMSLADDNSVADEESYFSNHAQAQKAENIIAVLDREVQKAQQKADSLSEALAQARTELEGLQSAPEPDQEAIQEKLAEISRLDSQYLAAQTVADEKLAAFANVSEESIADMRAAGMGWGEICHQLGVHPGNLGNGHIEAKNRSRFSRSWSDTSLVQHTNRNSKKGFKDAVHVAAKSSNSSKGNSSAHSSQGKSGKGEKGGKGQGGGNGNGNGKK
ncbi:MAG: hypothetical protein JXK94_02585 [Deltaproteobacteria bacterium]|nr:hypothetical protein [Deltaproteobacteria bacterium]